MHSYVLFSWKLIKKLQQCIVHVYEIQIDKQNRLLSYTIRYVSLIDIIVTFKCTQKRVYIYRKHYVYVNYASKFMTYICYWTHNNINNSTHQAKMVFSLHLVYPTRLWDSIYWCIYVCKHDIKRYGVKNKRESTPLHILELYIRIWSMNVTTLTRKIWPTILNQILGKN